MVLVGGVAQAFAWRWDAGWLTAVTSSQFLWALLCCATAYGWSRGRLVPGALAGGITGLGLIGSYYAAQWLTDSRHAAVSQFTDTGGAAWTAAAVIGGSVLGLLGAAAATSAVQHRRRRAFGLVGSAVVAGGGPAGWLAAGGEHLQAEGKRVAAVLLALVGAGLVAFAVRRCGPRETIVGGAAALLVALALLVGLYVLQHTVLYLTF